MHFVPFKMDLLVFDKVFDKKKQGFVNKSNIRDPKFSAETDKQSAETGKHSFEKIHR